MRRGSRSSRLSKAISPDPGQVRTRGYRAATLQAALARPSTFSDPQPVATSYPGVAGQQPSGRPPPASAGVSTPRSLFPLVTSEKTLRPVPSAPSSVEQRVEEAERRLAMARRVLVGEQNAACHQRCRCAGAPDRDPPRAGLGGFRAGRGRAVDRVAGQDVGEPGDVGDEAAVAVFVQARRTLPPGPPRREQAGPAPTRAEEVGSVVPRDLGGDSVLGVQLQVRAADRGHERRAGRFADRQQRQRGPAVGRFRPRRRWSRRPRWRPASRSRLRRRRRRRCPAHVETRGRDSVAARSRRARSRSRWDGAPSSPAPPLCCAAPPPPRTLPRRRRSASVRAQTLRGPRGRASPRRPAGAVSSVRPGPPGSAGPGRRSTCRRRRRRCGGSRRSRPRRRSSPCRGTRGGASLRARRR